MIFGWHQHVFRVTEFASRLTGKECHDLLVLSAMDTAMADVHNECAPLFPLLALKSFLMLAVAEVTMTTTKEPLHCECLPKAQVLM